jgi:hypothetical protein
MSSPESATPLTKLAARWRDAERRLYPLIMSAPELYERSTTLVRAVTDELRTAANLNELAALFGDSEQLVARAGAGAGVNVSAIDVDAVAGAAFALRYAELEGEVTRAAALERVAAARRDGATWATLYESGVKTAAGVVVPPYHLLEACLVHPWGLHASAVYDIEADVVSYQVEVTRVETETGRWWVDDDPPIAERKEDDVESWQAALADMRAVLVGTPVPTSAQES